MLVVTMKFVRMNILTDSELVVNDNILTVAGYTDNAYNVYDSKAKT